jgi:hypothetical protein
MITAGFLPACTAVWHRAVLELVRAGWWQDLPGADRWTVVVWLAIPAAAVTLLAIAAAALSGARALIVLVGLAGFVHPLLPLVLAPLALAVRTWPARPALVPPAIAAAASWTLAVWLTPSCVDPWRDPVAPLRLAAAWGTTIGLAGGALLAIDALFSRLGRWSQLAAALLLVIAGVALVSGRATDAPALLGASGAALWWRIGAGASHVVAWQSTIPGRVGAIALVALVPVLASLPAVPARGLGEPGTAEGWAALEAAGTPSTIMTTGGRADAAATIWRSGPSVAQRSLAMIPPDPDATTKHLATSAVYAWSPIARRLSMRGMLVAPVHMAGMSDPLLWRVIQFERCQPLTSAWTDISAAAIGGQFAGVFPEAAPNRGALVYFGSSQRLHPQPLDWPGFAVPGFDSQTYDRDAASERAALADMTARDGMDQASLGDSRYVTRVRFDRRNMAPDTLAVSLGGVTSAARARLYSEGDAREDRQPLLCRSSVGQPVTAYAGAPQELDIDLTSPFSTGSGWHAAEQIGESRFRWTEGAADVLFVAQRAQPLVFRLDAEPGTGNWSTAGVHVTLNGAEAGCRSGEPPCDWMLPVASMRTGVNVITLHSATVPAPPPDPRRLGLMVRAASLALGRP